MSNRPPEADLENDLKGLQGRLENALGDVKALRLIIARTNDRRAVEIHVEVIGRYLGEAMEWFDSVKGAAERLGKKWRKWDAYGRDHDGDDEGAT